MTHLSSIQRGDLRLKVFCRMSDKVPLSQPELIDLEIDVTF